MRQSFPLGFVTTPAIILRSENFPLACPRIVVDGGANGYPAANLLPAVVSYESISSLAHISSKVPFAPLAFVTVT